METPEEPVAAGRERLVGELGAWFEAHGRPLPWRLRDPGPWAILMVEVMSQQTPIARVVPVWQDWCERWPAPADLAAASSAEVIRAWGRMGYPRRALALKAAAEAITADHGGRVPRTEEELLRLPGVGPYTAAAVMAFAYGKRAVVLDTNIRRVLTRVLDGIALPRTHVRGSERERARALLPVAAPESVRWNAAVMEFGALVCTARSPDCGACPLTRCRWREAGYPANAPARRVQGWHGSDRQVRGAVMAQVRAASGPLDVQVLSSRVRTALPWVSESALEGILGALVGDGLLTRGPGGVHLPE